MPHFGWLHSSTFGGKSASKAVLEQMGLLLAPLQLGFGTSMGAESAHAARTYLHHLPPFHILVKLDFKNALNTIRRDKMLEALMESIPELFSMSFPVTLCLLPCSFTRPPCNRLRGSNKMIPLLVCLTIHSLITHLKTEFRVFYFNDNTVGEAEAEVLQDSVHLMPGRPLRSASQLCRDGTDL